MMIQPLDQPDEYVSLIRRAADMFASAAANRCGATAVRGPAGAGGNRILTPAKRGAGAPERGNLPCIAVDALHNNHLAHEGLPAGGGRGVCV